MSAPDGERDRRRAQAFRNLVAAIVIGSVVLVLAALYVLLWPGAGGAIGAMCTIGFLTIAFFAWEFLMKPGYGFMHRRRDLEPEDGGEEPPSPRAP